MTLENVQGLPTGLILDYHPRMQRWYKKLKKPPRSPKEPAPLEIPTHIVVEPLGLLSNSQVAAEAFGPLRTILGDMSAIYKNHEVRLRPPTRILLTIVFSGNHRRQE